MALERGQLATLHLRPRVSILDTIIGQSILHVKHVTKKSTEERLIWIFADTSDFNFKCYSSKSWALHGKLWFFPYVCHMVRSSFNKPPYINKFCNKKVEFNAVHTFENLCSGNLNVFILSGRNIFDENWGEDKNSGRLKTLVGGWLGPCYTAKTGSLS